MNAKGPEFLRYYIRATDVKLFNNLVASAEEADGVHFQAAREGDSYVLRTNDEVLWQDLYLYGQMLAQAQGEMIEGGQV